MVPVVSALYVPNTHAEQVREVPAPTTSPYRPAAHAVQAEAPEVRELYAPAAQAEHAVETVLATTLPKVPAAHAVHAEAPESVLYAPAKHDVHTSEEDATARPPYMPTPQVVQVSLTASDIVPPTFGFPNIIYG